MRIKGSERPGICRRPPERPVNPMNGGGGMISGDNDVNTPAQLAVALFMSAIAHALFFAGLIAFSLWSPQRKIIVPGYKVDLVTLTPSTPASLLPPGPPAQAVEPEAPKPAEPEKPKPAEEKPAPEPMVKSAPPPVKKAKAEPEAKNKKADAPKKIMAKNEDSPKKEKESESEPKKTKAMSPIETASIPPAPRGSVLPSTSTPRPSGGGLITEGLAFPHTWYLQILERKANENWITHGIIIAGNKSDPVVRFNILKNGRVDGLELEKSSGNEALDESALAAISKASPFPQLPADYGSDHLTVHFTFTYEQRD